MTNRYPIVKSHATFVAHIISNLRPLTLQHYRVVFENVLNQFSKGTTTDTDACGSNDLNLAVKNRLNKPSISLYFV